MKRLEPTIVDNAIDSERSSSHEETQTRSF